MKKHFFVIPDPDTFISGGNLYNKNLMKGLEEINVPTILLPFNQFLLEFKKEQNAIFWLDTLFFKQLSEIQIPPSSSNKLGLLLHLLPSMYPQQEDLFQKMEKPLLDVFDHILTPSAFCKNYLVERNISASKIIVLPPALAVQPFDKAGKTQFGLPLKIGIVSNLSPVKGIFEFLKAWIKKENNTKPNELEINIIGSTKMDIPYSEKCISLIEGNDTLKNIIHFKGSLSPEALGYFYETCDLLVSVAHFETFGMALQEARAFGLPILGLDRGNVKYHIHEGNNGYSFSKVENLVQKILELVEDKGEMERISRNAWENRPNIRSWGEKARELVGVIG